MSTALLIFSFSLLCGILLCLGVIMLDQKISTDKNCFMFEPVEMGNSYEKSQLQVGVGIGSLIVSIILGGIAAAGTHGLYQEEQRKLSGVPK